MFYPVAVQTQPDIHIYMYCTCDVLPKLPIFKCAVQKEELLLLCKHSQSSPARARIVFPESSVWSSRRKLQFFARRKTSSEDTIPELSSVFFFQCPNPFADHKTIVFWCLSHHVIAFHLHFLTTLPYQLYVQAHTFSSSYVAVFQFHFNLRPASFGTQLQPVLLTLSQCQLVSRFPSHIPHVSNTSKLINFQYFRWIRSWYQLKTKDGCPIFVETTIDTGRHNCFTVSS